MRLWLGSTLFTTYMFASVAIYGPVALVAALFSRRHCYAVAVAWVDSVLFVLRVLCGLSHEIEGLDNLPGEASVVLMKHSSTWETLAQLRIFPDQTWVLKRELMRLPIFGWVLARLRPIAIDRTAGRTAVEQVIAQGTERLQEGLWVVIFPEGTRVPAGEHRKYGLSGALLAGASGRCVVPVAHNAGEFWPRRGWLKRPGTIKVAIGPPIDANGRDPREINDETRSWIDARLSEFAADRRATPGDA